MRHLFRTIALLLAGVALAACSASTGSDPASDTAAAVDPPPPLLSWTEQISVREDWLRRRHELLLPMMRRHEIDMWIVVNEEFHDDPLTEYVAPARPYTGRRDIFVFVDAGEAGLRAVAATGYWEETVARFFESPVDPGPAPAVLREVYEVYAPERIGLGTGGRRGMTRSLTHDSYEFLAGAMGPKAEQAFVSAEHLIEEYLATRLPEESDTYTHLVHLTEHLTRRALSSEVIHPGQTTVGDVRDWLYDRMWEYGVGTWFQPDLRVQRRGMERTGSRGFLAVAPEETVIGPGDLVHIDFGISYMGLDSDWQKMAYVLLPGESEAPAGLEAALDNTNRLQDVLTLEASRPGRTVGEVYGQTMDMMQEAGIQAQVYSHPLGNHGHGLGPSIDFRSADDSVAAAKTLVEGAYISIELNTLTPVPEWDGQEVFIMQEDPAQLTANGWRFFRPRQESLYLIESGAG